MSWKCPACEKMCDVVDGGGLRVVYCKEHGEMKRGNVYSDVYMTHAHPDLKKEGDAWVPKTPQPVLELFNGEWRPKLT